MAENIATAEGASTPPPQASGAPKAVFTQGSTMRHVAIMSLTGSVGLMAVFVVEMLTLLYIARLKDDVLTAGIGYATLLMFIATSVNIGMMIAISAMCSRAIGAGKRDEARRIAGALMVIISILAMAVTALLLIIAVPLLTAVGANAQTLDVALTFLVIALPANLLMALGMGFSGVLRAVGDARRAMYVTLAGAIATAAIDPILIFSLDLGVVGAAIGLFASRLVFALVGFYGAVRVHNMVARPAKGEVPKYFRASTGIAGPAILTNLATPIASLLLLRILEPFGEPAIAANTIADRLVPVAFGVSFAISGAVGPILGQNWGARQHDRVKQALTDGFLFAGGYVLISWIILFLARDLIVSLFGVTGQTADYVRFFCLVSGLMWLFNGMLFVANAAFNSLGFPLRATLFNWGKATLGTVPFAWLGAHWHGVEGLYLGVTAGAVIFGIWSAFSAYKVLGIIKARDAA
jgi:putative MATE family efflux protein